MLMLQPPLLTKPITRKSQTYPDKKKSLRHIVAGYMTGGNHDFFCPEQGLTVECSD